MPSIQNYEHVTVSLDKRSDSRSPQVILRQGDINGTIVHCTVTDSEREVDLTGAEAWFEMAMSDGETLYRTSRVTVEQPDEFDVPIDESLAGLELGKYRDAYIRFEDAEGNLSSTASFTVQVIAGIGDNETLDDVVDRNLSEVLNGKY